MGPGINASTVAVCPVALNYTVADVEATILHVDGTCRVIRHASRRQSVTLAGVTLRKRGQLMHCFEGHCWQPIMLIPVKGTES
jgi:hypothetical protein